MTERPHADDPRLLSAAEAISEGVPIDWQQVAPDADAETTSVLHELRVVEGVSRLNQPIPDAWGQFAIRGEIGHGSYGIVYRAFDANLHLEVALKVIRPRTQSPFVDGSRGLNEARLLAQVNHPNVVRVYQAERLNEEIGLAMELVQGRTLKSLVREHGPFSAREAMLIGVDVCCALAAVHGVRLVHGDVKAQNVMRATGGRTVLMDFGAGYDVKTDPASGSRLEGTPMYLAPEVFAGGSRTALSDIYSVGVLLYYLATGSYPVDAHAVGDVSQRHQNPGPRRLLRDVRPDLPDEFIRVVERATAERPQERYQTAGELEAALDRALRHGEPVPVPAPRPFPFGALAVAGALVVIGLGVGLEFRPWTPRETSSSAAATLSPAVAASPVAAPDTYSIEAAFYREQGGSSFRLASGARIAPGDRLSLRVASSVPTYVYVVNEDDRGKSFLLFPLPGQELLNPLPVGTRHEIPGKLHGERTFWTVSTAGGREHFLIFASPQRPTPTFERMFASLPRPSADTPIVMAQPLSTDMVGLLRGVGGLAVAPARSSDTSLNAQFGAPLPDAAEAARGVWVRQLTLENPTK
jgi:eukaryotic-like serine/threonine-protein kinase